MKTTTQWKPVVGYEGLYQVSSDGHIRSLHPRRKGQILPQRIERAGYFEIQLSKKGVSTYYYVHRLVAAAFIPNSENKPCINHRNGIKTDNRIENLEWVTHSENMLHAAQNNLCCWGARKRVVDECSGTEYPSIKAAAADYKLPYSTCKNYLNGNRFNPTCLRLAV